jgi:hypothetical protein
MNDSQHEPIPNDATPGQGPVPESGSEAAGAPPSETPAAPVVAPREAPAPDAALAALASALDETRASLAKLAARSESDSLQLKRKDEIIAKINDELIEARAGFVSAILRPIFEENVRLVMEIEAQLARAANGQPLDGVALLESIRQRVLIGLENCGLYQQPTTDLSDSPRFNPRTQVITRTIDVEDPERHQHIARVVMPSFQHEDKALLRERVEVYRFRKADQPTSGENPS